MTNHFYLFLDVSIEKFFL